MRVHFSNLVGICGFGYGAIYNIENLPEVEMINHVYDIMGVIFILQKKGDR